MTRYREDFEVEAAKAGFVKVLIQGDQTKFAYRIQCAFCDAYEQHQWGSRTPPEIMVRNLRRKHWVVDFGDPPRCPKHARMRAVPSGRTPWTPKPEEMKTAVGAALAEGVDHAQRREAERELDPPPLIWNGRYDTPPVRPKGPAHDAPTAGAPISEVVAIVGGGEAKTIIKEGPMADKDNTTKQVAPRIQRVVINLLEEHFDADKGLYRGQWGDAKVAKEAGTTEEIVAWVRDEAFGELAGDPRITELRAVQDSLTADLEKLMDRAGKIETRLSALEAERKVGGRR